MIPYNFDPVVHRIVELTPVRYLRRELKLPQLVGYHHRVFGTWVLSFKGTGDNGRPQLLDVGLLGTGEGETPDCTAKNMKSIIKRLKTAIHKMEVLKQIRQFGRDKTKVAVEDEHEHDDAIRTIHRDIKKRKGSLQAERWIRKHPMVPSKTDAESLDL